MRTLSKLLLLLALAAPTAQVNAQAVSNVSGTIETVMMDDGYIVISGKRLVVRGADLVITYKGEALRPSLLDTGMTVLYSTRSDGSVSQLTLTGPVAVLEALQNQ